MKIDIQAITNWLKTQGMELTGRTRSHPIFRGASNWTYRLKYANRDLILRRPPKGTKPNPPMIWWVQSAKALQSQYPRVPNMVALCTDDRDWLRFYVMDRTSKALFPRQFAQSVDVGLNSKSASYADRWSMHWLILQ